MSVFVYLYGDTKKKLSFIIHRTQGRIVSNEYQKNYAFGTRSKWTQLNECNTDFRLLVLIYNIYISRNKHIFSNNICTIFTIHTNLISPNWFFLLFLTMYNVFIFDEGGM